MNSPGFVGQRPHDSFNDEMKYVAHIGSEGSKVPSLVYKKAASYPQPSLFFFYTTELSLSALQIPSSSGSLKLHL
jgi:hypothetical protein